MRMLLKANMDTEAANIGAKDGKLAEFSKNLAEGLKAEAAYFAVEDGRRSCFVVFDMVDSSQIPAICEPLFLGANAKITLTPCMSLEDLTAGLAQMPPMPA